MPQSTREISKALSWLLRHQGERLGLVMDAEGYATIPDVLAALATHADMFVSEAELRHAAETDDPVKQRFSILDDCIRANYGHSLAGQINHPELEPPPQLYHGTSEARVPAILREGLRPMQRQYVHLTGDMALARSVGGRHGPPSLLVVDAQAAYRSGIRFYCANPRFWLVSDLPAQFLSVRTGVS